MKSVAFVPTQMSHEVAGLSTSLRFWVKYNSWNLSTKCASMHHVTITNAFRKECLLKGRGTCACEGGKLYISRLVPTPLCKAHQRFLSPFDIHGDYVREKHGYVLCTDIFTEKVCADPVQSEILAVQDVELHTLCLAELRQSCCYYN